jgi:hypothetical protein
MPILKCILLKKVSLVLDHLKPFSVNFNFQASKRKQAISPYLTTNITNVITRFDCQPYTLDSLEQY